MNLKDLYDNSVKKLSSIENAENEVRYIFKKVLSMSDSDLILNRTSIISDEDEAAINSMVNSRLDGKPIQYILGEWDFCGLTFKIDDRVLIPRSETEILCEFVLNYIKDMKNPYVADLCAGSGCIGITIKHKRPDVYMNFFEKSLEAARCLSENVSRLCPNQFTVTTVGDILNIEIYETVPQFDVIVSNPPYVRTDELESLQSEVKFEPTMALDGGEDGLDFYRYIITQWTKFLKDDGLFAFECGEGQAEDIESMLKNEGFSTQILKDYRYVDRFVIGKRLLK